MHADEVPIDEGLVVALVAEQFPHWADKDVTRVASSGTDNAMFRLGEEYVVRLPRIHAAANQVAKEQRWLPYLAPRLPLDIPVPVGQGRSTADFDMPWSVYRWLPGCDAATRPPQDPEAAAQALGAFVFALRSTPHAGGPPSFRGGPVATRDADTRVAIADLGGRGEFDEELASAYWESALSLPPWTGAPVWLHSDLLPGNLLTHEGHMSAVIDFGGCGTGDPACDLMAGWTVFDAESRETFRRCSGADSGTWDRGRSWAFCFGLGAWHYYEVTNPPLAAVGRRAALAVLADVSRCPSPRR